MKWSVRRIISILMIMLMVMPFTWQVFADEPLPEDQEISSVQSENAEPEPQKEAVKTVHEEAEAPAVAGTAEPVAAETPAAPEAEDPAAPEAAAVPEAADIPEPEYTDTEAGHDGPVTEAAPAALKAVSAPESGGGSTGEAETAKTSEAAKIITVDDTSIDGSEDCSGSGWNYEKESGRIVLRDYTGSADITSDGTGVDIVSTGYNRIGTLSCDGDINVIGTGVLLIDKVELAEGCSFNLIPLKEYDGEDGGSVAVFLLQEDGSYMLVNKTVKGIIDERVELPENIKLVLPADSMLELQAFKVKVETEEPEDENYEYYCGHLCVGDLTLNDRSKIINKKLGDSIAAGIIVGGNLINEGLISGGSVTVVQKDSGGGGLYSGSGTIEDSNITFRTGQTMSINIKGSTLNLEQGKYTIEQLGLEGESNLYYGSDTEITNLEGASGSTLDIYSYDITDYLRFTGTIDGVDVLIKSGITELADGLKFLNGGTVSNKKTESNGTTVSSKNYGSLVFDYNGESVVPDVTDNEPVFIRLKIETATETATEPDSGSDSETATEPDTEPATEPNSEPASDPGIPVVYLNLQRTINIGGHIELIENSEGQEYVLKENYKPEEKDNGKIYYDKLIDKYFPDGPVFQRPDKQKIIAEVLRFKDNKLSLTILDGGDEYGYETDSEGVFLIRLAFLDTWENSVGGTTVTSTRASQTGSGNIGGNSKSIITGTGITRFSSVDPVDPDPVKPDPDPVKPDPDPVKPDPDPVKPDPDPAKPSKKDTVAAGNVSGDTLAILINEFDLNEGKENAEKAPYYSLSAYVNGAQISKLNAPVKVGMDYVLPEEFRDKPLYAVFANEDETSDETLTAVSAVYDEEAGKLTFETPQLGEFIIVAFEFDGEEFSPEFYDELEKTDEAKLFIKHLEEKKKNAGL